MLYNIDTIFAIHFITFISLEQPIQWREVGNDLHFRRLSTREDVGRSVAKCNDLYFDVTVRDLKLNCSVKLNLNQKIDIHFLHLKLSFFKVNFDLFWYKEHFMAVGSLTIIVFGPKPRQNPKVKKLQSPAHSVWFILNETRFNLKDITNHETYIHKLR